MEQLNNALPIIKEEKTEAAANLQNNMESPLLRQVRQKFEITGFLSLIFGCLYAFSFYDASMGINALFFTGVMVILLILVMKKFDVPMKNTTYLYYCASLLLGLSSSLTANGKIQAMNTIGTIFLLNLSLLHQLHEDGKWEFAEHFGKMIGMLFYGFASIPMPFVDSIRYMKRTRFFKNDRVRNVFLGLLLSVPILWLLIVLLSGADILFSDMTIKIFTTFFSPTIFIIGILILFGFFSCYCILCGAAAQTRQKERTGYRKGNSAIAETVMFLICIVYAVFCGFQFLYLFAGGFFALPEGITYSEYARGGFFQLLAVTIINVALMVMCTTFFEESRLLRILLTLMTACTYIMIFSAGYRMLLYVAAYKLTFLRLLVLLALVIIALVLAGVIVSVFKKSFPLFRYSVAVITICYISFSLARPDYWIAAYLIQQKPVLEEEDAAFLLMDLSLDAAPVVVPLLNDSNRWEKTMHYPYTDVKGMYEEQYETDARVLQGDWTSLDYKGIIYYKKIHRENRLRGIRDFNVSVKQAFGTMEKNPIRFYTNE